MKLVVVLVVTHLVTSIKSFIYPLKWLQCPILLILVFYLNISLFIVIILKSNHKIQPFLNSLRDNPRSQFK